MCLGIPAEMVDMVDTERHLATVEVVGVRRTVDVGLLEEGELRGGDWVLVHVGFAMARIDEEEARRMLESLQLLGAVYAEEVEAVRASGTP